MNSSYMAACTESASSAKDTRAASRRRERFVRLLLTLSVLVFPLICAGEAKADPRTDLMISRLHYPPDPGVQDDSRLRLQAALGLGATNDDNALQPLCKALNDPAEVVRQAAALALKRLGRSAGLGCLRGRLSTEGSSIVKLQLTRAIADLESSGSGGASATVATVDTFTPKSFPGAKFYVSISSITNNTGRSQSDVDRVVLGAMRTQIESTGKHQIAPIGETSDIAKSIVSKRKMKGFYLAISVDKFDYSDGNLRVRIKCAVFSYPGKSLLGEVPSGLTQSGVSPGDKSAEDNLMGMASQRAVDLFMQNFN
ncbi:MAG: HEAT repeat domain-containing protein [Polyangiaceae bacterium]